MKKLSEQCQSQRSGECGRAARGALSTPVGDGSVLFEPSVGQVAKGVAVNGRQLSQADVQIGGVRLGQWRREARRELLALAGEQNRRLGLTDLPVAVDKPLIVTGHQCVFFHCGILVKYMLVDQLARRGGGVALNLVVDNDLPKHLNLTAPVRAGDGLKVAEVPLAEPQMEVPMEYQPAPGSDQLARFADRLEQLSVGDELRDALGRIAAVLDEAQRAAGSLADLMMMLNHRLAKSELGLDWLELPVSIMAGSRVFAGFVCDMLVNAERVRGCYNGALARWAQGDRAGKSKRSGGRGAGPLPELAAQESPFWLFRRGQRRCGLFVRREGDSLVMGDGRADVVSVPVAVLSGDPAGGSAALLAALKGCNVGIRPRAVTLTAFARLFLADMFVHGLGGARYDQVTDLFIGDYYGLKPPIFACTSATMHLPVGRYVDSEQAVEQLRQTRHDRRDLRFNPQRYVKGVSADRLNSLLEQRRAAIARSVELGSKRGDSRQRREVFEQIRRINAELLAGDAGVAEQFDRCVSDAENRLVTAQAAYDREYFFGLFSGDKLKMLQSKLS